MEIRFKIIFISIFVCISFACTAQDIPSKKGSIFFYWGYNRSIYAKSDLHFKAPDYDITFYSVKAQDRPTKLGWDYVNPSKFSIPQNNYRIGYFFTDQIAVSIGVDHMKYVVEQNQNVLISGVISPEASTKYQGSYLNEEIQITGDLLQFEHTDGLNLLSLDFDFVQKVKDLNSNFKFSWGTGLTGIWIVAKTNVKLFGEGLDNDFHIAGYHLGFKTGPRIDYKNKFFLITESKFGYANLRSILIENEAPDKGNHDVTFLEFYLAIGYLFKF